MTTKILSGLVVAIFLLAAICSVTFADTGPKGSATMHVTYNGNPINETFYGAMLYCANSTLIDTQDIPAPQLNVSQYDSNNGCSWIYDRFAWGGVCTNSTCFFSYFPPKDLKMAIYLPSVNKTFITNELNNTNFTASYNVAILGNNATISNTMLPTPPLQDLLTPVVAALIITILIELAVAYAFLRFNKIKNRQKILLTVVLANIISVPLVWLGFVYLSDAGLTGLALGEIFAVIFEGYLIYYMNKKLIDLKKSLVMSLLMNIASFVIGGLSVFLIIVIFGWI